MWKQKISWSLKYINKRRSEKCYALIRKRYIKGGKHIASMDFGEYLRKSDVSENSNFIMVERFLRNGLHERHCYIGKSEWDVQYRTRSASHYMLVERWRWNWMSKVFAESILECPYVYYFLLLLRGRLHLLRDIDAEKEGDIGI